MMPEMSGHEVIQKIRKNPVMRDTSVIFITALTDDEDEAKGLELGAVDYVTKPINIPITLARVKTHLSLRLARKKLEEQNRQLIEAAKLREDVERMSRHDLKSPLSVILATPDLLMMKNNLLPEQIEMLQMIRRSGYRMLDMIDRSLDLYKMETGVYPHKPEAVDLVAVVRKIVEETQESAAFRQISLEVLVDGNLLSDNDTFVVSGEELLCYSMLANLIKNALEASPEAEKITMSLERGNPNIISIHNKGEVPKDIRERFFEKYSTSGKKHGTGLGTYSARVMAETQGGSIHLDTSVKGDTTVTVHMH